MMQRFYQLRDEMLLGDRWHIGAVRAADGSEPLLDAGIHFAQRGGLTAEVTSPGRTLDFTLTSFGVPVVSANLSRAIKFVAQTDVECIAASIDGEQCFVMNAVRVIHCVDESRSEFIKWATHDHRVDLVGQYRQVTKLVIDPRAIPDDAYIFRLDGWLVGLIVRECVKMSMENAGCFGAKFVDVSP